MLVIVHSFVFFIFYFRDVNFNSQKISSTFRCRVIFFSVFHIGNFCLVVNFQLFNVSFFFKSFRPQQQQQQRQGWLTGLWVFVLFCFVPTLDRTLAVIRVIAFVLGNNDNNKWFVHSVQRWWWWKYSLWFYTDLQMRIFSFWNEFVSSLCY